MHQYIKFGRYAPDSAIAIVLCGLKTTANKNSKPAAGSLIFSVIWAKITRMETGYSNGGILLGKMKFRGITVSCLVPIYNIWSYVMTWRVSSYLRGSSDSHCSSSSILPAKEIWHYSQIRIDYSLKSLRGQPDSPNHSQSRDADGAILK